MKINRTTTTGQAITIDCKDPKGNPAVGDSVTETDTGKPVKSDAFTITEQFASGQTTITTNSEGKISKIKSKILAYRMGLHADQLFGIASDLKSKEKIIVTRQMMKDRQRMIEQGKLNRKK